MSSRKLILAAVAVLVVGTSAQETPTAASAGSDAAASASQKVEVKGFTFQWAVEGENLRASLAFKTSGWVAVGFNPTRKMKDANFIIGYAGPDGASVVDDEFGDGTVSHSADTALGGSYDIVESSCSETDGVTTMKFVIPLADSDAKDVKLEAGKEITVIFGAGKKDNLTSKHSTVAKTTIKL